MAYKAGFEFILEYVSDVEAAKKGYVNILGLDVERYHPTFVQFKDLSGSRFAIASDGALGGNREREVYWLVGDAEALCRDMSPVAEIALPLTVKPFGKVFGVKDPAGQVQYLLEFATNRPSQPAR